MLELNNSALAVMHSGPIQSQGLNTITLYSGTIPNVDPSFVFNQATYASQVLARFPFSCQPVGNKLTGPIVAFDGWDTGVATWFALSKVAPDSVVILGTISSDPSTKAPMLIDNVNITASSTKPFSTVAFTIAIK